MAVPPRIPYLDALKVAMTAGVISAHAAITYGVLGSWFFHDRTLTAAQEEVLDVPIALGALFAMGLFFFVAGYFVPDSLARHGTAGFLRSRSVRLGVPFLVFVLGVIPLVTWVVADATGLGLSFATVWLRQLDGLDSGPAWFIGVLLLFSVIYAAVRQLRNNVRAPWRARRVGPSRHRSSWCGPASLRH